MISTRIRQVRLANGLTLEAAAERVAAQGGIKLTRAAFSNYERGKRQPRADVLRALARALSVSPGYFLQVPEADIQWLAFRCTTRLGKRRADEIRAAAQMEADRAMFILDRMPSANQLEFPKRRPVTEKEQADAAAAELRAEWGLGEAPIECLCQTAEDHGAVVVSLADEATTIFDGVSGVINGERPLLTVNTAVPPERVRFNLAHEIGHVLMDSKDLLEKEAEGLAHRFASSLLVPPKVVKQELGERRRSLSFEELGLLKQKYGLSMAAWMYAARAHSIVSDNCYRNLCVEFSRRGWRKREPVAFENKEEPQRLRQLTLRALAENLIGTDEAERLCPGIIKGAEEAMRDTVEQPANTVRKRSAKEREKTLEQAATTAASVYEGDSDLTDFEAFGEGDLYDEHE